MARASKRRVSDRRNASGIRGVWVVDAERPPSEQDQVVRPRGLQTKYRGIRFRSRTEARWAVFLDFLHQPWQYEPRRLEFEDEGTYLPDFWLPGVRAWMEVKPYLREGQGRPQRQLALEFTAPVYVAIGSPAWPSLRRGGQLIKFAGNGGAYSGFGWTCCEYCGRVGIDSLARSSCSDCGHRFDGQSGPSTSRIVTAVTVSSIAF